MIGKRLRIVKPSRDSDNALSLGSYPQAMMMVFGYG